MSYYALARKWRPRQFSELVGQDHVVRALRHALGENKLHHALLFSGTRGVGKTTLGRLVSKGLNCEQGVTADPCGECQNCREIEEGRFVDLIEVDAASRTGVDDTRDLLENVQYAPAKGRRKVYLIDEVHMLSKSAFNALLKTLEEPPEHVQFLLATTDPQKLPVTVLSRCLQFHLKRLPQVEIQQQLEHILEKEEIGFEAAGISQLARAADGSMRDGLSLLDQAIAYGGGQINATEVADMLGSIERSEVLALLRMLADSNAAQLPELLAKLDEQAPDYVTVLDDLASSLQQIALLQAIPGVPLADDEQQHEADYVSLAGEINPEDVQLYYQIAVSGKRDMPFAPNPRIGFEMILLRMLAFHSVLGKEQQALSVAPKPAPQIQSPSENTRKATKPAQVRAAEFDREPDVSIDGDENHEDKDAAPAPKSQGSPNGVNLASLDAQSWPQFAAALPLAGLGAELVKQCAWGELTDKNLSLKLAPSFENLKRDRYCKEVEEILQKQADRTIRLRIEIVDHNLPTAAQCDAEAQAQRMQEAEQAILEDPNVRALQEKFGASIHPGSVEPQ